MSNTNTRHFWPKLFSIKKANGGGWVFGGVSFLGEKYGLLMS
jgi:hypothetical protein